MKTKCANIPFCPIFARIVDLEKQGKTGSRINLQERSGTNALTVNETSERFVVNHATAAPC